MEGKSMMFSWEMGFPSDSGICSSCQGSPSPPNDPAKSFHGLLNYQQHRNYLLSTHAMVILCLSANLWISKDFKKVSLTIFFWVLSALVGCKRWGCLLRSQEACVTRAVQCAPAPPPVCSAARRVVRQPTPVPEGRRGGAADLLWDPGADPMWTQVC